MNAPRCTGAAPRPTASAGRARWVRAAVWLFVATQLEGCAGPVPIALPPLNVVILLGDALRADRLGAYGNARALTPTLDSLAEESYVFRHAYAPAPWTAPTVAALFTARLPSRIGVNTFQSVVADGETTLAEVLSRHGYFTAAFLSHWFLMGIGLDQGFDRYQQYMQTDGPRPKVRGSALNERVLEWLDQQQPAGPGPLFLYVHYSETHIPYTPPPEVLARVLGADHGLDLDDLNRLLADPAAIQRGLPADRLREVRDAYDSEVAAFDQAVGELLDALAARDLRDNTVVVITADHGESFQEHASFGHANSLFNEVIHVPLVIKVPGAKGRVEVDEAVSLIDVAPTVLDLLGIAPPASCQGRSLAPAMRRAAAGWLGAVRALWDGDAEQAVVSERAANFGRESRPAHDRAVIIGTTKHVAAPGHPGEFYDLRADPEERHPDALSAAERARLANALARLTPPNPGDAAPTRQIPVDGTTRERLRALGYGTP